MVIDDDDDVCACVCVRVRVMVCNNIICARACTRAHIYIYHCFSLSTQQYRPKREIGRAKMACAWRALHSNTYACLRCHGANYKPSFTVWLVCTFFLCILKFSRAQHECVCARIYSIVHAQYLYNTNNTHNNKNPASSRATVHAQYL
jgi:hypothetical protein